MKTRKNKFRKRNSEETRAAILQAVGDILRKDGHHGLSVTKVAAKADVDPKNIYAYFGDYNNLLKDYIHSTDSWFPILGEYGDGELPELSQLRDIIIGIFQNQFDTFGSNIEMQKFIFWQISSVNATMREVSEQRESRAALLLELADKHAKGGDISPAPVLQSYLAASITTCGMPRTIRAVSAALISIYQRNAKFSAIPLRNSCG